MLRNRLYYSIKPFVPRSARLAVRRWFASRKRSRVDNVWPVMPGSERPPKDWRGWPNGKQFAFVLTHDVEGQSGVDKSPQLMQVEAELGFRSSFNFIPEGDYRVSSRLCTTLRENGFEVGVHDLNHDGKLYSNRADFARKAVRINQYLAEWQAVGFRSGFMLHNLEWLHDLNVEYDASTFDTDPFEPQSDGVGTIFPYWVSPTNSGFNPSRERRGYVELPYTLPQDSTLFLIFRERTPDVWLRKLDWVAQHGGMALVNVHPDYIQFPSDRSSSTTFPLEFYSRLLTYVRDRYAGSYWQPLAREAAEFHLHSQAQQSTASAKERIVAS
jgi:hypothetical protein